MNLNLVRQLVSDSVVIESCMAAIQDAEKRIEKMPARDFPEYVSVDGHTYRITQRPLRAERLPIVDAHQMSLDEIVHEG